jgi:hypothetical protein
MENFWNFVWIVVWCFLFVAYLMVLFYILTDLFRDRELSGWWKAVWVIFLIFVPFLTALVYLIARGNGMSERSAASVRQAQGEQDAYIRQVTGGGTSAADSIANGKALLDDGTITQSEFNSLKAKALA